MNPYPVISRIIRQADLDPAIVESYLKLRPGLLRRWSQGARASRYIVEDIAHALELTVGQLAGEELLTRGDVQRAASHVALWRAFHVTQSDRCLSCRKPKGDTSGRYCIFCLVDGAKPAREGLIQHRSDVEDWQRQLWDQADSRRPALHAEG